MTSQRRRGNCKPSAQVEFFRDVQDGLAELVKGVDVHGRGGG